MNMRSIGMVKMSMLCSVQDLYPFYPNPPGPGGEGRQEHQLTQPPRDEEEGDGIEDDGEYKGSRALEK